MKQSKFFKRLKILTRSLIKNSFFNLINDLNFRLLITFFSLNRDFISLFKSFEFFVFFFKKCTPSNFLNVIKFSYIPLISRDQKATIFPVMYCDDRKDKSHNNRYPNILLFYEFEQKIN